MLPTHSAPLASPENVYQFDTLEDAEDMPLVLAPTPIKEYTEPSQDTVIALEAFVSPAYSNLSQTPTRRFQPEVQNFDDSAETHHRSPHNHPYPHGDFGSQSISSYENLTSESDLGWTATGGNFGDHAYQMLSQHHPIQSSANLYHGHENTGYNEMTTQDNFKNDRSLSRSIHWYAGWNTPYAQPQQHSLLPQNASYEVLPQASIAKHAHGDTKPSKGIFSKNAEPAVKRSPPPMQSLQQLAGVPEDAHLHI